MIIVSSITLLLLTFQVASATAQNTTNGTNTSLCVPDIREEFAYKKQVAKCDCALVDKYQCCYDARNAVYCGYALTPLERTLYVGWEIFTFAFNLLGMLYALYCLRQDYLDQKKKNKRGTFKYKVQQKSIILILILVFFFITALWAMDPHDGLPTFGVELWPLFFQNFTLRLPQWLLVGVLLLFILVWRDLVQSAQKLVKKSKQRKEEEARKQRRIVYGIIVFLLCIGTALSSLRDVAVPGWVTDYASNFLVMFCVIFLGLTGSPYYAYKVQKIVKSSKSASVKKILGKIVNMSIVFFIVSFIGVASYISVIMQDQQKFSRNLQNYIVTHTAQSLCSFFVAYSLLPKNSSRTHHSKSGRSTWGSTVASRKASTTEAPAASEKLEAGVPLTNPTAANKSPQYSSRSVSEKTNPPAPSPTQKYAVLPQGEK